MNTYIVNESCKNIRAIARGAMNGLWKPAMIAVTIYLLCTSIPVVILDQLFGVPYVDMMNEMAGMEVYPSDMYGEMISPVSGIYTLLVTGAFTLGMTILFIDIIRNRKADIGNTFAGFGYYFKALGLLIVMAVFIGLWSLLFIVPGIIAALRYSMAFYILADDPDKGIMECIRESKALMKGNKWSLIILGISFIGWMLLAGCFLGIFDMIISMALGYGFAYEIIISLITIVATCGLTVYVYAAETVFYEMANGNLRPASNEMPPLSENHIDNMPPLVNDELEMKVDNNKDSVNVDKIEF